MINNSEYKNALKGQHNLAQGNALGLKTNTKIVRAIMSIKAKILFRTKQMTLCFPEMLYCNSLPAAGRRPKQRCRSYQYFFTNGFSPASLTQGGVSVRSSRNYALG